MSKLVIVESPAKAKTIAKYLGSGFQVKASMGHLRDLPKKTLGVDIEKGFIPQYIPIEDKDKIINELKEAAEKSDFVYLATDPDREGEAISWHLKELLGLDDATTKRITFNEITEKGVKNGTVTESGIPYSVRIKAEKKVTALSRALTRNSMISTAQTIRRGGGYTVTLSLSDGVGEIVSMDVFAINEAQANALEQGFIKNAESIYNKLIDMILEEEPS